MEEVKIQPIAQGLSGMPQSASPGESGSVPQSGEPFSSTEEVVILESGQEQSQKFIKAISNQNASEVMQLLRESGPLRLSDIAERQGMSLNATKYHIGNLMDAGLLEISNTRYSVKGRKIKLYRMKNQIFIVAPSMNEKQDIISAVMRYASFLGLYIFIAVVFLVFVPLPALPGSIPLAGALQPGMPASESLALSGFFGSAILALLLAAVVTLVGLFVYIRIVSGKRSQTPAGP